MVKTQEQQKLSGYSRSPWIEWVKRITRLSRVNRIARHSCLSHHWAVEKGWPKQSNVNYRMPGSFLFPKGGLKQRPGFNKSGLWQTLYGLHGCLRNQAGGNINLDRQTPKGRDTPLCTWTKNCSPERKETNKQAKLCSNWKGMSCHCVDSRHYNSPFGRWIQVYTDYSPLASYKSAERYNGKWGSEKEWKKDSRRKDSVESREENQSGTITTFFLRRVCCVIWDISMPGH